MQEFFSFNFPLHEFFFLRSPPHPISFLMVRPLVVSASRDAGGHRKNNLTFGIGLHVVGVRTFVRTLRHNHIFSDG